MSDLSFWKGKRVFVTGHTGFKGSWLSLLLSELGAKVRGYSLPATSDGLFQKAKLAELVDSQEADIRDLPTLSKALAEHQPEIVLHLAAQPLVIESYRDPVRTFETNVMGTVNLLEAVRHTDSVRAAVNITTDKVYRNREWLWAYRENEELSGFDPYSNSKSCSELVTESYRNSFFPPEGFGERHQVLLSTARAGNVIGGGDSAQDRLIPDIIRSFSSGKALTIRNPESIRPWQHVLEPVLFYLDLARRLHAGEVSLSGAWNIGPDEQDARPVRWIVETLRAKWGKPSSVLFHSEQSHHEARLLRLDTAKARTEMNYRPRWNITKALDTIVEWELSSEDYRERTRRQIHDFLATPGER